MSEARDRMKAKRGAYRFVAVAIDEACARMACPHEVLTQVRLIASAMMLASYVEDDPAVLEGDGKAPAKHPWDAVLGGPGFTFTCRVTGCPAVDKVSPAYPTAEERDAAADLHQRANHSREP